LWDPYVHNNSTKWTGDEAPMVEDLLLKCKALGSKPRSTKTILIYSAMQIIFFRLKTILHSLIWKYQNLFPFILLYLSLFCDRIVQLFK
jgi:hypothetical protein